MGAADGIDRNGGERGAYELLRGCYSLGWGILATTYAG